ncbi:hypothetical protein [Herbaspirillum robiniae]|uniref:hypothetical protein n=1 Tax=Herbaspirillum robiniae TaxID=2014887 RepID=UPI003D77A6C8
MTHELMHAPTHLPAHERALVFTRATSPAQGHPAHIVAIIPIADRGPDACSRSHAARRKRIVEMHPKECIAIA